MSRDYYLFVDGGSLVPYYVEECTYIPLPQIEVVESYSLDYKTYCKTRSGNYYVRVAVTDFVRLIRASDFELVKKESLRLRTLKKVQLLFEL